MRNKAALLYCSAVTELPSAGSLEQMIITGSHVRKNAASDREFGHIYRLIAGHHEWVVVFLAERQREDTPPRNLWRGCFISHNTESMPAEYGQHTLPEPL